MGYIIIPKPNFSDRGYINFRCHRFDLLLLAVLSQSVAAMTAVVTVRFIAVHWRGDSVLAIFLGGFRI